MLRTLRLAYVIAVAAALVFTSGAAGGSTDYPAFATPDGVTATSGTPNAAAVPQLVPVSEYKVPAVPADPIAESNTPPGNFNSRLWGYEAAGTAARILQYDVGPTGMGPVVATGSCIPTHTVGFLTSQNGRGMAFDPQDGNLWNTHVLFPGFIGDGFIHKNTPPPMCTPVTSIPFGDGPGGTIQDDIGAIDVDEASKHLWVAGYNPVLVGTSLLSYIYKVNRNDGTIIDSCAIPFRNGGVGNDTLAVLRNTSLPGSSKYLLTDAGEPITVPNTLALIDQADCHDGLVVTPVAEFNKNHGLTGIDFEWPGLFSTNGFAFFNDGDQPFATSTLLVGGTGTSSELEDISLCAFRAKFGGDGNDKCPY